MMLIYENNIPRSHVCNSELSSSKIQDNFMDKICCSGCIVCVIQSYWSKILFEIAHLIVFIAEQKIS